MSIILEGIDLPKNKDEYMVIRIYGNGRTWENKTLVGLATQIPTPHGRLIDASELIKSYMKGTKTDIDDFYDTIDIIDNAPTILKAEEER